MSLKEQQDLLARLYTDPRLRARFVDSPEQIGTEFGLSVRESGEIAAVMPEELEFFAQSLLSKRLREVEKLLPLTRRLAEQEFSGLFRLFASGFNPTSVKKHLEDALAFADYLLRIDGNDDFRDAVVFERTRLAFNGFEKRFAFCRIGPNVGKLLAAETALGARPTRKRRFAVWLRTSNVVRHYLI